MRLLIYKGKDGRMSVNWMMLLACVIMVPVVVVGAVEVFWYKFSGGFSPLMGLFGLIAAILIVIRLVGETLARRTYGATRFPEQRNGPPGGQDGDAFFSLSARGRESRTGGQTFLFALSPERSH